MRNTTTSTSTARAAPVGTRGSAQLGLLRRLRELSPVRPLTFAESSVVAERQANALLDWFGVETAPTPFDLLDGLHRFKVVLEELPTSGSSHWTDAQWLIALNRGDHPNRQRFSLFHELKHVIDHHGRGYLYPPERWMTASRKAERCADVFAACVLMPKRLVKSHFFAHSQDPGVLAEHFEVSAEAMRVRLTDLGLIDTPRSYSCQRSASGRLVPGRRRLRRSAHDPVRGPVGRRS